jgi:nucleoside-diphosphate-sugar epimerase
VLGTTEDLPRLVKELGISQVVITIAQISRQEILHLIGLCRKIQVSIASSRGLYDVLQGKVRVTRIRNVQIEDLLGREPVYLDEAQIGQFLAGKRVMVTGRRRVDRGRARAPGRPLPARQDPPRGTRRVRALRHRRRPAADPPRGRDHPAGGRRLRRGADARDPGDVRPQVIFHAAAHKHVPMMESNPGEAIKNNVLASRLLAELAGEQGVEAFVMISTDKAVRPTSIMGATKRVAELSILDLARRYPTRYEAVRFGNVIGSAGSVVPIFREQIRRGGPVTVTHPEMRRYFMTIPEAAQLVLQAGAMGEGGEIFILDMGEPVRILDLAEEMITLTGLRPYVDMDIVFTGLRPGEKALRGARALRGSRSPRRGTRRSSSDAERLSARGDRPRAARGSRARPRRRRHGGSANFLNSLLPEANLGVRSRERDGTRKVRRRRDAAGRGAGRSRRDATAGTRTDGPTKY